MRRRDAPPACQHDPIIRVGGVRRCRKMSLVGIATKHQFAMNHRVKRAKIYW